MHFEYAAGLSAYELGELKRVRFGSAAAPYRTDAGPRQDSRGIERPAAPYSVVAQLRGRRWTLSLRDRTGRSGTLSFRIPRRAEVFGVDPRDGTRAPGGGPVLYKEYRVEAPVALTGIFRAGVAGKPRIRLILQGRGNVCFAADDFTHWRFQVSGPRADFAFYGALRRPARG